MCIGDGLIIEAFNHVLPSVPFSNRHVSISHFFPLLSLCNLKKEKLPSQFLLFSFFLSLFFL
ncbi:hypothetical protein LguiA_014348 [Lonicera macranthoides]